MQQLKIVTIVGSLRSASLNQKLIDALATITPSDMCFEKVSIDLPLYNQDDDNNPVTSVIKLREQIKQCHGVIIATPEYNRSIPGVLKNALDHASRPYGQNVFSGKPTAILGVSVGVLGTSMAQQHLRNILSYLNAPAMASPEVYLQANDQLFQADGSLTENAKVFLNQWIMNFHNMIIKKN
jgi:chromate reductase